MDRREESVEATALRIDQLEGEISELRDQLSKVRGRLEDAEDTVSGIDRERILNDIAAQATDLKQIIVRLDEVEDTVSECDGLRHRVDDLESQVEDMDAVTTDQVEDIVSDRMNDMGPLTCRNIVTLGLRGLVDKAVTEGVKI
jgi:predicted  nucleic acid-binding Zn-ribbon protein